jgi:hypothetical protein
MLNKLRGGADVLATNFNFRQPMILSMTFGSSIKETILI